MTILDVRDRSYNDLLSARLELSPTLTAHSYCLPPSKNTSNQDVENAPTTIRIQGYILANNKVYIRLILLVMVIIFIVQNATVVDIQLPFWKVPTSRSLMIFFVLAIGIVIGWITAGHFSKKH